MAKKITQELLLKISQNKAAVEALEKEIEKDEADVFAALKGGATCESGLLKAEIEITPGKRTTKWKERAIEYVDADRGAGEGEKWAARVIAATKPGESTEKVRI